MRNNQVYAYYDENSVPIAITACLEIRVSCSDLSLGDIIEAKFERGSLNYDGGGEHRDNAVGCVDNYTIGIGVPDTQSLEENIGSHHRKHGSAQPSGTVRSRLIGTNANRCGLFQNRCTQHWRRSGESGCGAVETPGYEDRKAGFYP